MAEKRKLFEEVGAAERSRQAETGVIAQGARRGLGMARVWLVALFVLVVVMIAVGGLTRLTDSGLSITEWRPVTGALPPMSQAAWETEFAKYRAIPEFALQNAAMTLDAFKSIYWWEWSHRQVGRFIGLVWAIGFFGMLAARRMPRGWSMRFLSLGVLGGLQGALGWWMVSSGLTGRMVDVASYRLAMHLGLAFIILGLIAWFLMALARGEAARLQARRMRERALFGWSGWLAGALFAQVLLGALVAGIDAGRTYTDWPWMAETFLPPEMFALSPWWANFFENPGLVQFIHRMVGYLVFVLAVVLWRLSRRSGNVATRRAFDWVLVGALGQMTLGIGTVLYAAPLGLGLVHQLGAVMLWVLVLFARFSAGYPRPQSVRG